MILYINNYDYKFDAKTNIQSLITKREYTYLVLSLLRKTSAKSLLEMSNGKFFISTNIFASRIFDEK